MQEEYYADTIDDLVDRFTDDVRTSTGASDGRIRGSPSLRDPRDDEFRSDRVCNVLTFRVERTIGTSRYTVPIYEETDGYGIYHWDSESVRSSKPAQPVGQTPNRLKGRRPIDRR